MQAFSASSAPYAETRRSFVKRWPTWGSESQSGWYPSTLLLRHEGTSAVHSQGLDNFIPSLADDQPGRTTTPLHHSVRGTSAVMPANAFTHEAGSRQKYTGELPQQPSGALHGTSASLQAGGGRTEQKGCASHSLPQTLCPHTHNPLLLPQALAAAPVPLLCCRRHPPALLQLDQQSRHLGVCQLRWRGQR